MAEYIGCRNCDSPDCKGCNLKNLETMLKNGKFDCLMNENRCINPSEEVSSVVHGWWIPFHSEAAGDIQYCSACEIGFDAKMDYCPHCGAKMESEEG